MVRVSRVIASVTASALVLVPVTGLAASPAQAANLKPDGSAIVRVSGGTAVAKETGKRTYRVVVPQEAGVNWLGKVSGRGYINGTFTKASLVKSWGRLGYRSDVGVQSTIMWSRASGFTDSRNTLVSDLRINKKGDLVFTAKVTDRQPNLPKTLPDFALNLARADEQTPRYSHQWGDPYTITGSLGYYTVASGDTWGYIQFVRKDASGAWVNCPTTNSSGASQNPSPGASGAGMQTVPFPSTVQCGGATVSNGYINWQGQQRPGNWSGFSFTYTYNGVGYGGATKWSWTMGDGGSGWMP